MPRFPVVYQRATTPGTRCQPGASALLRWCLDNTTATNLGCFVVRPVRGGSALSTHAEGRAVDLGFPYTIGGTPAGWRLAELLREHHADLGVQYLIYARKQWTATRNADGWRDYTGASAHYEHIHAELNRTAAEQLTGAMIDETLQGATPMPDRSELIAEHQRELISLGYQLGSTGPSGKGDDGDYGPKTRAADKRMSERVNEHVVRIRQLEDQLRQAGENSEAFVRLQERNSQLAAQVNELTARLQQRNQYAEAAELFRQAIIKLEP